MARKTTEEMEEAIANAVDPDRRKYSGMTYEEGIRDALEWASGDVSDEDFEFTND